MLGRLADAEHARAPRARGVAARRRRPSGPSGTCRTPASPRRSLAAGAAGLVLADGAREDACARAARRPRLAGLEAAARLRDLLVDRDDVVSAASAGSAGRPRSTSARAVLAAVDLDAHDGPAPRSRAASEGGTASARTRPAATPHEHALALDEPGTGAPGRRLARSRGARRGPRRRAACGRPRGATWRGVAEQRLTLGDDALDVAARRPSTAARRSASLGARRGRRRPRAAAAETVARRTRGWRAPRRSGCSLRARARRRAGARPRRARGRGAGAPRRPSPASRCSSSRVRSWTRSARATPSRARSSRVRSSTLRSRSALASRSCRTAARREQREAEERARGGEHRLGVGGEPAIGRTDEEEPAAPAAARRRRGGRARRPPAAPPGRPALVPAPTGAVVPVGRRRARAPARSRPTAAPSGADAHRVEHAFPAGRVGEADPARDRVEVHRRAPRGRCARARPASVAARQVCPRSRRRPPERALAPQLAHVEVAHREPAAGFERGLEPARVRVVRRHRARARCAAAEPRSMGDAVRRAAEARVERVEERATRGGRALGRLGRERVIGRGDERAAEAADDAPPRDGGRLDEVARTRASGTAVGEPRARPRRPWMAPGRSCLFAATTTGPRRPGRPRSRLQRVVELTPRREVRCVRGGRRVGDEDDARRRRAGSRRRVSTYASCPGTVYAWTRIARSR